MESVFLIEDSSNEMEMEDVIGASYYYLLIMASTMR